jgi:hypothetical protein
MSFNMQRTLAIAEILDLVKEAKDVQTKVSLLRQYDSETLRYILELAFHPNVGWWLPEGSPPYTPSPVLDTEGRLYKEARTLPLYLYGNRPDLKKHQRENLFIGLLESLHPKDAALLIAVKDKKVEGLNVATINEAFPGLIPNEQNS